MLVTYESWCDQIAAAVRSVDDKLLKEIAQTLRAANIILTAGNGGSHALASHAAQALMKPGYVAGGGKAAVCLTDMVPSLTSHANDGGWETALQELARPFFHDGNIVLWLFSSSGRSHNIVGLARQALAFGGKVVSFTGFDSDNALSRRSSLSVHIDSRDYEVIEPVHDALLHRVQYHLRTPA